jgi:hypothetical protein
MEIIDFVVPKDEIYKKLSGRLNFSESPADTDTI